MEVTLEPKTRNGKNRLAAIRSVDKSWWGMWHVVRSCDRVNFAPGKSGPWHLIEPICAAPDPFRFRRWVSESDDDHFTVRPNN